MANQPLQAYYCTFSTRHTLNNGARPVFNTSASVQAGGVYLLGSMDRQESSVGELGVLGLAHHDSEADGPGQVWVRCYRISGWLRS